MDLPKFEPETRHLKSLLDDRDQLLKGRIPTGIAFLDDCLGGIYPRDLYLIGAGTGVGKTEAAFSVVEAAGRAGKRTYLFALEAEVGELSARLYFRELARQCPDAHLDYGAWWRGKYQDLDAKFGKGIREKLASDLATVRVLYKKKGDFTPRNLHQQLEAISSKAEVVVLDHIHVIDRDDTDQLRVESRAIRMLRDLALDAQIPVVVVSHVRKALPGSPRAIPSIDDLHGCSNLSKVATQVVMFARDWDGDRPEPHLSPTFIKVAKDRKGRATGLIARTFYNLRSATYQEAYELGKLRGQKFEPLPPELLPSWASHAASPRPVEDEEVWI